MSDLPVLREVFDHAAVFAGAPTTPAGLARALSQAIDQPDPVRRATGEELAHTPPWARAARAHLDLYEDLVATSPKS
jgi:hypothetical protein